MKAAVITLHSVYNYGTQLQAYATQEKLKEYFDEVYIIDYRRKDTYGLAFLNTFAKGNPIKALAVIPTILCWKRVFGKFQSRYLNISGSKYLNDVDMKKFKDDADVYFTGSDQVWNTGWNRGVILPYYLNFIPDDKPRYGYAVSFGMNKIPEKYVEESMKHIQKYDSISVREESGITILKEQYHYENVLRLLDPTLAMPASFWRKIEPKRKIEGDYILIYNLQRSRQFNTYAEELSKRTGLKLYRFCTRLDQIFRNGKSMLIPDVLEFISLIDYATIVLTDSFHATAFSMNLETEPICIYPDEYSGRLSEFLDLVDSKQRHVSDYNDFDVIHRHVDFEYVRNVLEGERKKTDKFLLGIKEAVKK